MKLSILKDWEEIKLPLYTSDFQISEPCSFYYKAYFEYEGKTFVIGSFEGKKYEQVKDTEFGFSCALCIEKNKVTPAELMQKFFKNLKEWKQRSENNGKDLTDLFDEATRRYNIGAYKLSSSKPKIEQDKSLVVPTLIAFDLL